DAGHACIVTDSLGVSVDDAGHACIVTDSLGVSVGSTWLPHTTDRPTLDVLRLQRFLQPTPYIEQPLLECLD
ncbi:hypothetical protein, partial [Geobacillus zalihae]|uniref:hypothetical protein n=1 Tax=Geobacillus zalihae TaxID=213419 RepID=UPI001A9A030C